jgi:hypothetical protein
MVLEKAAALLGQDHGLVAVPGQANGLDEATFCEGAGGRRNADRRRESS